MATIFTFSHFTPITFLYFLLLSLNDPSILAFNITDLLSPYPDLSDFSNLLTTTAVAADLTQRSSLTILAVPNSYLRSSPDLPHRQHPPSPLSSPANLADVVRSHVLLEYLSWPDLRLFPPAGKLITTLFQTTGRASGSSGYVNITRNPSSNSVTIFSSASNATVLTQIKTIPYNISVFTVTSILVPYSFDLTASDSRPRLGLNIAGVLIAGQNFNIAAAMLTASGVEEELEEDEGGAGITLFVPTDEAFSDLPSSARFQSLPAGDKATVLRFHVLRSYYPLGSLESIVNPFEPTLATEEIGAGRYTLNISKINGSFAIDTGISQATVTRTVFDQNPVAIFGVSSVLLPKELFGNDLIEVNRGSGSGGYGGEMVAQPPDSALSAGNGVGLYGPSSRLTSPPGWSDDRRSKAVRNGGIRPFWGWLCIAIALLFWN